MTRAKLAFIFCAPDSDPSKRRSIISNPQALDLMVPGFKDYDQAAQIARELADHGREAILSCAADLEMGIGLSCPGEGG